MNWIYHIDLNSFFASVEQQLNPKLRGRVIGVGGKPGTRSIISAASYEAKARGVKTAMPVHEAIKICPELIVVQPHYQSYKDYSQIMFKILESFSPDLEIFSIDEGFLKIISNVKFQMSKIQEVDYLINTARQIKRRFSQEMGQYLTASIGVAHNKKLAKLASDLQKPNGLVFILEDDEIKAYQYLEKQGIKTFLRNALYQQISINDICGIGKQLTWRLNSFGIYSLADLADKTYEELKTIAFPYHRELYLIGQGQDLDFVHPYWKSGDEKSIGHQYTLPRDVPVSKLKPFLAFVAAKVGYRMRQDGFIAHRLNLWLRLHNRSNWQQGITINNEIQTDRQILELTWQIIERALDDPISEIKNTTLIRMPSITATNLVRVSQSTRSIFACDKDNRLSAALDAIKNKFGPHAIQTAWSINLDLPEVIDGRRKRLIHN